MQGDDGAGLRAGGDDRVPVAAEHTGQSDPLRALGQGDRPESSGGVAPHLRGPRSGSARNVIPQGMIRSGWGCHQASNIQSFQARVTARPRAGIGRRGEHTPREPGDLRREIEGRPHPVESMSTIRASTSQQPRLMSSNRVGSRVTCSGRRPATAFIPTCEYRLPSNSHTWCPAGVSTTCGAFVRVHVPGSRPSNMSGGSTRWSSTEITVARTCRGAGSGSRVSVRVTMAMGRYLLGSSMPVTGRGEVPSYTRRPTPVRRADGERPRRPPWPSPGWPISPSRSPTWTRRSGSTRSAGADVRDRMPWGEGERADVYLGPVMITLFTRAVYEDAVDLPDECFLHPALFTDDLDAELEGHTVVWGPAVVEGAFGRRRIAFVDGAGRHPARVHGAAGRGRSGHRGHPGVRRGTAGSAASAT